MTHPSKRKGNGFEREIVKKAVSVGLSAKRAYASNGESLGLHAEVDCVVAGIKVQAKRRKKIAAHLIPSEHVDCVITRQDCGDALVIMRINDWLEMVAAATSSVWTDVAIGGGLDICVAGDGDAQC